MNLKKAHSLTDCFDWKTFSGKTDKPEASIYSLLFIVTETSQRFTVVRPKALYGGAVGTVGGGGGQQFCLEVNHLSTT